MTNKATKIECPVIYEGRGYFGIKKFDGKVVHLFTEKTLQGTLMTSIPFSGIDYRSRNPTKAKAIVSEKSGWVAFTIYDDWGDTHNIEIHTSLSEHIDIAKQNLLKQEMLLL